MPLLPRSWALGLGRWCLLFVLGAFALAHPVQAQDEEESATDYETEFNYGINFNTNGGLIGGVSFKYAWQRSPKWYNRVQLEVVNLKHPKEYRASAHISSFIPNKFNYLLAFRPSFGQEFVLFQKAPEEGVQLNVIFGAGPTLGITKPYYVLYADNLNQDALVYSRRYDPNDPTLNPQNIQGAGRVTDGLDQLGFIPGFHVRGGLSFESGRARSSVFGIEGGFVSEVYTRQVPLLKFRGNSTQAVQNPSMFNGLYLILYYGTKN